jgi:hypothetical protein
MATARSVEKGKPLVSSMRLFTNPDKSHTIKVWGTPFLTIHPDNRFEVVIPDSQMQHIAPALSICCNRVLPFLWARVGKGRYRMSADYCPDIKPEVFQGLTFDMDGKQWLNAKADRAERVLPEQRVVWLRARRKFLQAVKTRHKLGVFEAIRLELVKDADSPSMLAAQSVTYPNSVTHSVLRQQIYKAMTTEDFSTDMAKLLVSARLATMWFSTWRSNAALGDMSKFTKELVDSHSVWLREQFGVFSKE